MSWLAERRVRFGEIARRGPGRAGWVWRAVAAHQAKCEACMRVAREVPPPPELPRAPGVLSWMEHGISRLPHGLRLPVQSAQLGLFVGSVSWIVGSLSQWLEAPGARQVTSAAAFLWPALGAGWLVITGGLLRPLADRSPYLAGQLWSASLVLPAALAFGMINGSHWLHSSAHWVMIAIFSGLIGLVLGNVLDPDGQFSQFDPDGTPVDTRWV